MKAKEIISRVENDLGFTGTTRLANPKAKLQSRIGECVMQIHDSFLAGYVPKEVKTVAGQGEYDLGAGVDKIKSIVWPGDWVSDVPSLTASHSVPSDITGELVRTDGGLYYAEPSRLRSWQTNATQYGGIGTYPMMYAHWINDKQHFIFAIADKNIVTAGETILLELYLSQDAAYGWDDDLPLEDHYKTLMQILLAQKGCEWAQGEFLQLGDVQMQSVYRGRESDYREKEKQERARLRADHNPTKNKSVVHRVDTPWYPNPSN